MHTTTLPLVLIALAGQTALAQPDYRWVGGPDGRWDLPMNWSPPGVPNGPGVTAEVSGAGAESIDVGLLPPEVERLLVLNPLAEVVMGQNQGLLLRGASVNEGLIRLTPSGIDPLSLLVLRENASIGGGGTIRLDGVGAEVGTNSYDVPWSMAGGQTIVGSGVVRGLRELRGTVRAEGERLHIESELLDNHGLIAAATGATVRIERTILDQREGGIIQAAGGQVELATRTTVRGGRIDASDGQTSIVSSPVYMKDTHVSGLLWIRPGQAVALHGNLRNDGTILIGDPEATGTDAWMRASMDSADPDVRPIEISGSGEIVLTGSDRSYLSDYGRTIINGPEHTVRGAGVFDGTFTNYGRVIADVPGERLLFRYTGTRLNRISNHNVIECRPGSEIVFGGSVFVVSEPDASIKIDGGRLELNHVYGNRWYRGGTISVTNGGALLIKSAQIDGVNLDCTDAGDVRIVDTRFHNTVFSGTGSATKIILNDSFINNGLIRVEQSIDAMYDAVLRGMGTLCLTSDGVDEVAIVFSSIYHFPGHLTNSAGHTLAGSFLAEVGLFNRGTLSPGTGDRSVGIISGDIRLQPEGLLIVDIGDGPQTTDLLELASDAVAGGRLKIRLEPGFEPGDARWARTIVTTDSVDPGRFAEVDAPAGVRVVEIDHEIRAGVSCPSDLNLDLTTNLVDAQLFVRWFVSGDDRSDLAEPFGTINVFDLSAFIGGLGAGCR